MKSYSPYSNIIITTYPCIYLYIQHLLPYITFIVFLLVLSVEAQTGLGRTLDNEGKDVFPLLYILILYISSSLQFILFQNGGKMDI